MAPVRKARCGKTELRRKSRCAARGEKFWIKSCSGKASFLTEQDFSVFGSDMRMGDLPPVIRSVQRSFVCRSAMVFYRAGRVGRPVAGTAFAELPGKINQLKPFVMKKIILVLACAFGALALNAQTEKVVFGKMPKSAQEFVQTYFAKENVQDVELNRDDKSEKYTVPFANGNQVVFDNSGDWTEINMKVGPVPANVVPANIKAHVSNNYSKYQIVQMMQNDKGYQVKLSNGTDLYYDKDGNILKTSD